MAACSSQVWEGMEVQTNSPEIRQARRDIVELLLDNHHMDCQTCERDGHCELQNLAYSMGVRARHFEGRRKRFPIELSSHSVVRDSEKCVLCGRCVRVCARNPGRLQPQPARPRLRDGRRARPTGPTWTTRSASSAASASTSAPRPPFWKNGAGGRSGTPWPTPKCTSSCKRPPRSARPSAKVLASPPGTPATGKMVTALRRLGFDRVFDTDFGADLTIIEEAHEFLTRLKEGPLPMITSCSPGWINFMEKFYPELIPHASTCRSPMSMLSALAKTYYAEKAGIDPKKIFMVAVMPCVAKKYEARRPEHSDGRRHRLIPTPC